MKSYWPLWMVRCAWISLAIAAWTCREQLILIAADSLPASLPIRLCLYCAVYVALAGIAVPGAVLLTALAGPMFGVGCGTLVASCSSTAGATIAFLLSRRFMFRPLQTGCVAEQHHAQPGVGAWELLILRLTPVIPFFAVNVLAGRSRLTVGQFWMSSQIGMLPATYLLVHAGASIPASDPFSHSVVLSVLWPLALLCVIGWIARVAGLRFGRIRQHFSKRPTSDSSRPLSTTASMLLLLVFFCGSGCALRKPHSTLDSIYSPLAKLPDYERNPVIVIPGVLGSRLVDDETGKTVWGKYDRIHLWRQQADDLAAVALPMKQGVPLSQLHDSVRSDGTLAYLELKVFGVPVELQAYQQILQTLGVGGYRDPSQPSAGDVVYGEEHFTCFQFDYDWRRDVAENAAILDKFIAEKREYIRGEYATRYGITDGDIKFDIVSHSLGGLLTRYYLRYGAQQLPEDGSLPALDWAGASNVSRVVMVGTPNAGSAFAIRDLVNGHQLSRFLPYYPSAALGTMPSIYQMLPRPRHQTLVDAKSLDQALDFYDPELWRQLKWGLANPDQDDVLQELLPDVATREERQCIARDHQQKCLLKAKQLHQSLDIPASPPPGVTLHLYAGDAIETPAVMSVDTNTGDVRVASYLPGDDTTTRHSALMSEQPVLQTSARPTTPINWTSVMFLHTSHRKLTADPVFTDNVLALLLQSPRDSFRSPITDTSIP